MIKNMGNSVYYLAHVGLGGVLAIALMSIIANKLSTDELGWFVLAQTYSLVFTGMANLGVLVGYERNFFVYEKSPSDTAQLFSSAVLFVTFNLLVLIVFIYIFRFDITQAIIAKQASTQLLFLVLCGSAISSIIQYYLTFLKNSSLAKRFFQFAILQILLNFSISMFLLFTTNLKSLSLAYAWLFSNATVLILLVFSHKKLLAKFNKTLFKEVLRISLPLTPRVFFGFINTQLDKIMLGLIATTGSVAIYNIGQLIAQTIFQFMTALGRVFQPEVYRKLFAKEQDNLLEINNYILPFFYVSILIALLVALFSKEFVGLFFPIEYSQATLIVLILSIYYASLFFGKITGNQLIYAKKTHITSLLMLIGVTLNVSLNFVFIKNWGMVGAAWATTISGLIMGLVAYFVAQKYVKILWQWKKYWFIYLLFLLTIVFALADYKGYINADIFVLIVKVALVLGYITLGFWLKIITMNQLKKITNITN